MHLSFFIALSSRQRKILRSVWHILTGQRFPEREGNTYLYKYRKSKHLFGPAGVEMTDNFRSNIIQRELLLNRPDVKGNHRHTVDYTAILVLPYGIGAGLTHFQQPIGAVRSHPSQQNSHGVHPGGRRD